MNPSTDQPGHVYLLKDCYFACAQSAEIGQPGRVMRRPSAFLNLGLDGPFEVEFADGSRRSFRAVLYAPGCPRVQVLAPQSAFLTFDLAARSVQYGAQLREVLGSADFLERPLERFQALEAELRLALAGRLLPQDASRLFDAVIGAALGVSTKTKSLDARVQRVLDLLHAQDPWHSQPRLAELATQVGLSESRLMHLFREHVGMPLRVYQQWLKGLRLIRLWRDDASITELAAEAGFHDAAHLSHLFSDMLGLPPTAYKDQRRFRIHRCAA